MRPAPSTAGRGGARPQGSPRGSRSLRLAVLGAVVAVLAVLLAPAMRSYLAQRAQITELRTHVAEQRSQVSALQKERAAWDDPAYVVAQARDRLKFVMPGERAYTVIDPAPKATNKPVSPIKAAERTATTGRAWYSDVWRSAQIAGQPQHTP